VGKGAKRRTHHLAQPTYDYFRSAAVVDVDAVGLPGVPCPVPIVSPVVPLFKAPLATPAPGVGRLSLLEFALIELGAAGDTAESPLVVVEPVLAFCADAIDVDNRAAVVIAMIENFMAGSSAEATGKQWGES
jgi:hypothetical protein